MDALATLHDLFQHRGEPVVLTCLGPEPLTFVELMAVVHARSRPPFADHAVRRTLDRMRHEGTVERLDGRPGRYRLTARGRRRLALVEQAADAVSGTPRGVG